MKVDYPVLKHPPMLWMEMGGASHLLNLLGLCAAIFFHSARNLNPDVLVRRRVKKNFQSREERRDSAKGNGQSGDTDYGSEDDWKSDGSRTLSKCPSRDGTPSARRTIAPSSSALQVNRSHSAEVILHRKNCISSSTTVTNRDSRGVYLEREVENRKDVSSRSHSSCRHSRRGSTHRERPASAPPTPIALSPNASSCTVGKPPLGENSLVHSFHRSEPEKGRSNRGHHRSSSSTHSARTRGSLPTERKLRGKEHSNRVSPSRASWLRGLLPSGLLAKLRSRRFPTTLATYSTHFYHSVPVLFLHYLCELQQQQAALPILLFSDVSERGKDCLFPFIPFRTELPCNTSSPEVTLPSLSTSLKNKCHFFSPEGNKFGALFSSSASPGSDDSSSGMDCASPVVDNAMFTPSFLVLREMGRLLFSYIVDLFFMDNTMVVRQLRSRHYTKRLVGWCARICSHSLLDPIFLSVLSPIVCVTVKDFSRSGPIRFSIPGCLNGLAWSIGLVVIQGFVLPTLSHLVNRATVTMLEALEYFIQRRYAYLDPFASPFSDTSTASFSPRHLYEEEDSNALTAFPSRTGGETPPLSPSRSLSTQSFQQPHSEQQRSVPDSNIQDVTASSVRILLDLYTKKEKSSEVNVRNEKDGEAAEAQHYRDQKKRFVDSHKKTHHGRQKRLKALESRAQEIVLRAIFYRMISLLVAQVAVDHPMNVLLEGMRGRAMMHYLGLLTAYDTQEELSGAFSPFHWSGWCSYWRYLRSDVCRRSQRDEEDENTNRNYFSFPPLVWILRAIWEKMGKEMEIMWNSIVRASEESVAISQLLRQVSQSGKLPSVGDSFQLAWHSCTALRSLYSGTFFSVFDTLASFYMATWKRLKG